MSFEGAVYARFPTHASPADSDFLLLAHFRLLSTIALLVQQVDRALGLVA